MSDFETIKADDLLVSLYSFAENSLGKFELGAFEDQGDYHQEISNQDGNFVIGIENNLDNTATFKIWDFDLYYETGGLGDAIDHKTVRIA